MNFHSSSFQVMGNRWIFSVNSPLPRRSELVSDWPKITRASVRRLHHLLFRISIIVERGVKSVGGGGLNQCGEGGGGVVYQRSSQSFIVRFYSNVWNSNVWTFTQSMYEISGEIPDSYGQLKNCTSHHIMVIILSLNHTFT